LEFDVNYKASISWKPVLISEIKAGIELGNFGEVENSRMSRSRGYSS
jgi:hypothetical protein